MYALLCVPLVKCKSLTAYVEGGKWSLQGLTAENATCPCNQIEILSQQGQFRKGHVTPRLIM